MIRKASLLTLGGLTTCLLVSLALAQQAPTAQWIWYDEGNPLAGAPSEARFFRHVFTLDAQPESARLELTADNSFTVWVNGVRVGSGDSWETMHGFEVKKHLVKGKNVLAVEANNDGGPAGLVVRLRYQAKGGKPALVVSNGDWRSSKEAVAGWLKSDFDDAKWVKSRVLGPIGKTGPWGGGGRAGNKPRFTVPEGYQVELAVKDPGDQGVFSLVNMTFDDRGRLLVSKEGGPILLCTRPDDKGVLQDVAEYCTQIRNCHGMCWSRGSLYLVGDGPMGTGLYRCTENKAGDKIDSVALLHRFEGGMGEHGPHAVLTGPDGWLYVVVGNHAFTRIGPRLAPNPEKLASNSPLLRWPTGGQGPDQGQKNSTEDVLLPRLNDARGHAANLRAPGGTIWRLDHEGKNLSLVAAGFRNQFDAAFSPEGELFSFDSDMEWDEGLPWYRAVRAIHCPPGADFVWRTGAANTPGYYIDSLPALVETGRGSPVGVAFNDHPRLGKRYRGAFLMADWSIGVIYAVHLKKKGGTYAAELERFCVGSPLNVTDLEIGPDGAVWFTMGGRGSRGGVYRIVPTSPAEKSDALTNQPLAPWSQARRPISDEDRKRLLAQVADAKALPQDRVRALTILHGQDAPGFNEELARFFKSDCPEVRAMVVLLLGTRADQATAPTATVLESILSAALVDSDALVRRRACEALVRTGNPGHLKELVACLHDEDKFVRTAARLVLQRHDPREWLAMPRTTETANLEAIVALCKAGKANAHASMIFDYLSRPLPVQRGELLDRLRAVQLACFHIEALPENAQGIASACERIFPHADASVNRELAILLTHFARKNLLTGVVGKLIAAIQASKTDRPQQIHYFYCLRLIPTGWSKEEKQAITVWYESTRGWGGGHSFTPFLENIYREILAGFDLEDRKAILAAGDTYPQASLVIAQRIAGAADLPLLPVCRALLARLSRGKTPRGEELKGALGEAMVRLVIDQAKPEHFDDLVSGLASPNKVQMFNVIAALRKMPATPKPEDPVPFRAVLRAAGKLDPANRWQAVELLRHWTKGKQFGAEAGQWQPELQAWTRWFAQTFPMEPALPNLVEEKSTPAKYAHADLLRLLTSGPGLKGDAERGRKAFDKAQCAKCHKYGKDGEGLGPDLTTLVKRFKRPDVLEAIYFPSKVISDQYRSTTIVTVRGQRIDGLVATQGDMLTVLLTDGTKVTLRQKDVEQKYASLVSVMPEKLLDGLSKEEIVDLFAYLESDPG